MPVPQLAKLLVPRAEAAEKIIAQINSGRKIAYSLGPPAGFGFGLDEAATLRSAATSMAQLLWHKPDWLISYCFKDLTLKGCFRNHGNPLLVRPPLTITTQHSFRLAPPSVPFLSASLRNFRAAQRSQYRRLAS